MATDPVPLRPHPLLKRYYSDEEARRRQVMAWFDESASSYDWINWIASFGAGSGYRREALLRAGLGPGMSALDVACGTGVLAAHAREIAGPDGLVLGLDPSTGMLRQARGRGLRRLVRAVAEALPFPGERFDLLTMGYALRHVADLEATFREYRRVLRPGGKLLILEITPPRSRLAYRALELYLGTAVPLLARLGRHGRTSQVLMRYYWDTIESCVEPSVILSTLTAAGFSHVERRVEKGILSDYTAIR